MSDQAGLKAFQVGEQKPPTPGWFNGLADAIDHHVSEVVGISRQKESSPPRLNRMRGLLHGPLRNPPRIYTEVALAAFALSTAHSAASAGISAGRLFRCVCRAGKHWGDGVTARVVWHVVKQYAKKLGFGRLAPHDLRRSCAKLCHSAGGELEQIQFLLGHVSVQTTERYRGCKQRIDGAVNDHIGIEP
jgi:hypothetical protein